MTETRFPKDIRARLAGKRALITGGLGMIGSTVAYQLVDCGVEVTVADSRLEPYGANPFNLEGIRDRVEVIDADIRDRPAMESLVKGRDLVFNFAGQASPRASIEDPFLDAEINYLGHLNVLESLRRHNPDAVILHAGSRLQYGPADSIPVDESHPLRPRIPYAINKTSAENMYRHYNKRRNLKCVMFRASSAYGPRGQMKHSLYSIVNFFIRRALKGEDITIFGDGSQVRDYIYVSDLAEAFVLASVTEGAVGEVFNIGSGTGASFEKMVHLVTEVAGRGRVVHAPWPRDYLKTGDYLADISKASGVLGWRPANSLQAGIEKTVAFYAAHGRHYF